jgi:hypothetical protein
MSEPRRLLEDGESEFERSLLRSAKHDAPSPALRHKTLVAFGLGTGVASAAATATATATAMATATAATATAARLALLKWIGFGVMSGVLTVAAVAVTHSSSAPPVRASAGALLAPVEAPVKGAAPVSAEAPTLDPAKLPAPSSEARAPELGVPPVAVEASRSVEPDKRSDGPRPAASVEPPRSTLADELATLDVAREAIAAGDASRAFQALDRHDRAFPRALLGPEATVLRVEAMVLRGDRTGAASLGTAFLAAHPRSPHASRIRSLIGATGEADGAPSPP